MRTRFLRARVTAIVVAAIGLGLPAPAAPGQASRSHGRLFPPQDLGLLEAPDRVQWQRPDQIMDALGVADASVVADVGAGAGWFTIHLARRVGPQGIVYAEDVQQEMVNAITRRVQREELKNVRTVLGGDTDPRLPANALDAILLVDAYHEMEHRVPVLSSLARSLKPQGRVGIVDFKLDGLGPGPALEERVSPDEVIRDADAAGLRLVKTETFLPFQYFLIFARK